MWIVSGVLLLRACGDDQPTIPDYPNSQNVQTRIGEQANAPTRRRTTFQTSDSPDTVLAFYLAQLPQFGWKLVKHDNPSHALFWYQPDCRSYLLDIEAMQQQTGTTLVQLQFAPSLC